MVQKEKIPPKDSNAQKDPGATRVVRPPKDRFGPLEIGENPLGVKEIKAVQDRGDSGSRTIVISPEEIAKSKLCDPNRKTEGELAIEPEEIQTAGSQTMGVVVKGVVELGSEGFGRKEQMIRENPHRLGHSVSFAPPQEPVCDPEDDKYGRVLYEGTDEHTQAGDAKNKGPREVQFMEEYTDEKGEEKLREGVAELPEKPRDQSVVYSQEQLQKIRAGALQEQKAGEPHAEWPESERTNYGALTTGANCQIFTTEEARKMAAEHRIVPKPPVADPAHTVTFTPDGNGGVVPKQNGKEVTIPPGMELKDKNSIAEEKKIRRYRLLEKLVKVTKVTTIVGAIVCTIIIVGSAIERITSSPNFITNSMRWVANKIIREESEKEDTQLVVPQEKKKAELSIRAPKEPEKKKIEPVKEVKVEPTVQIPKEPEKKIEPPKPPEQKQVCSTKECMYEEAIKDENGKIYAKASEILHKSNELGPLHIRQIFDLYTWLRNNVKYLNVLEASEPKKAELILEARAGDCKNIAALMVALGTSIGARMAIVTREYETNEHGYQIGHVYAAVRIYAPTEEEKKDQKKREAAEKKVKKKISKMIRRAYSRLSENIRTDGIKFISNEEGLWLPLDATYERDGYPGRLQEIDLKILERFPFGPEWAEVRGILE